MKETSREGWICDASPPHQMATETNMKSEVVLMDTTRGHCSFTYHLFAPGQLWCWDVWCIHSGSTLDSSSLVSHTATICRTFGFSSKGWPVINNLIFTGCETKEWKMKGVNSSEHYSFCNRWGETAARKKCISLYQQKLNSGWLQILLL